MTVEQYNYRISPPSKGITQSCCSFFVAKINSAGTETNGKSNISWTGSFLC